MMRAYLAGRFAALEPAYRQVARKAESFEADLAYQEKIGETRPSEKIRIDLAHAELAGIKAHLRELHALMEATRADLVEAIARELPNEDPEAAFQRVVYGR